MNLLDRQAKILDYLKLKNDFVTGGSLAKYFKISDRTVRNEINAIKRICGENIIVAVKTKGYKYNEEFSEINAYRNFDIISPNDRVLYILKNLIISNSSIDIYDTADKFFISERSIETDVTRINKILTELDLKTVSIIRSDSQIQLKNTYTVANNILYDIAKYNFTDLTHHDFQKIFPNVNIAYLGYLVINILNKHNHVSRYLSCTRFIIDIALFIAAIYHHNNHLGDFYADLILPFKDKYTDYYKNISSDISNMVLENFGIELNEKDIDYINHVLYINHQMHILENEMSQSRDVKDEFYHFCIETFETLKSKKGVEFIEYDESLTEDFILHLRIAMKRVELGIKLYNPLIENVTTKYMYLIDIAIMVAESIEERYGLIFSFNEISYIGIYLATAFHIFFEKIDFNSKLKILLYIPEGIGNLTLINKQIEQIIDTNKVAIDGITNLPSDSEFNNVIFNYSLIITTSQRFNEDAKNVFVLKKSFDTTHQNQIKEIIDRELARLERNKITNLINNFTSEKLFVPNLNLHTKKDVINHLADMLHEYGIVDEEFASYVFAREEIAPTDLETGVAFPHSLKNIAYRSVMAIAILDEPILWNTKKIRVVCMYANSLENSLESSVFIQKFMNIVFDNSFVDELKRCVVYNDCISILAKYLK